MIFLYDISVDIKRFFKCLNTQLQSMYLPNKPLPRNCDITTVKHKAKSKTNRSMLGTSLDETSSNSNSKDASTTVLVLSLLTYILL